MIISHSLPYNLHIRRMLDAARIIINNATTEPMGAMNIATSADLALTQIIGALSLHVLQCRYPETINRIAQFDAIGQQLLLIVSRYDKESDNDNLQEVASCITSLIAVFEADRLPPAA